MEDLLDRIQASEKEIISQLQNIHACEIDGKLGLRPGTSCQSVLR